MCMLSSIARQECVCEDEHGRDGCMNLLFHLHLCINLFNHGLTDWLTNTLKID